LSWSNSGKAPSPLSCNAGDAAGTALVTLSDASADDSSQSVLGDGLCVLSAVLYSCYTVIMQQQLGADDVDAPALFFGYIGVLTAAMGLPVVAGLHWWGIWDLTALHPQALLLALLNGGCHSPAGQALK